MRLLPGAHQVKPARGRGRTTLKKGARRGLGCQTMLELIAREHEHLDSHSPLPHQILGGSLSQLRELLFMARFVAINLVNAILAVSAFEDG